MKMLTRKPAKSAFPQRPTSPLEAHIPVLMAKERELIALVIEAAATSSADRNPAGVPDLEQAANALLFPDGQSAPPPRKSTSLTSLEQELATVRYALDKARQLIGDFRASWTSDAATTSIPFDTSCSQLQQRRMLTAAFRLNSRYSARLD